MKLYGLRILNIFFDQKLKQVAPNDLGVERGGLSFPYFGLAGLASILELDVQVLLLALLQVCHHPILKVSLTNLQTKPPNGGPLARILPPRQHGVLGEIIFLPILSARGAFVNRWHNITNQVFINLVLYLEPLDLEISDDDFVGCSVNTETGFRLAK